MHLFKFKKKKKSLQLLQFAIMVGNCRSGGLGRAWPPLPALAVLVWDPLPPLPATVAEVRAAPVAPALPAVGAPEQEGSAEKLGAPAGGPGWHPPPPGRPRWGQHRAWLLTGSAGGEEPVRCPRQRGTRLCLLRRGRLPRAALVSPSLSALTQPLRLCQGNVRVFSFPPHFYDNPDLSSFYSSSVFAEIKF